MADIVYIEQGYYVGDNYYTYTADAGATLNASAQILCDVTTIKQSVIDITSAFTPTLTASALKNHTAVLDAQFDITVTASRTVSNQSTLDNIVTLSLQGDRQAVLAATTLSSEFTQSTQANQIKSFNSTFNPAFSINADGDIVAAAVEAAAVLLTEFTQQVTGNTIKGVSVAAQSEFTHSTQADRIRGITTDILIAFQSANVITGFLQDAQVSITDAFTPTVTASALKNHTAVLDVVCTVSCVITKTTDFVAVMVTQTAQTTQASVTRSTDSTVESAFTQSSTVNKSVTVSSDHNIQFNTQITVGKVVRFTDTIVHTVTDYGGVFYIDGVAQPTLTLLEGNTYIFNHPSNHPIAFSTTINGTHGGGTEYTTGITRDVYNYKLIFVVGYNTPTLYYYCQVHSNMGGTALTPRPTVDITSTASATSLIWRSKWFNSHRPMAWVRNTDHTSFNGSIKKIGSHSLQLSNGALNTSDTTRRGLAYTTEAGAINTTGDFAFETWFYIESVTTNGTYHVASTNRSAYSTDFSYTSTSTASTNIYWNIQYVSSTQDLRVFFRPSTTTFEVSMNAHNMAPDQWNHIAFRRFSGTLQVFINGTKISVDDNNGGYTQTVTSGFLVLANNQARTVGTTAKSQYYDGLIWKQGDGTLSGNSNGNSAPTPLLPNNDDVYTLTLNNFDNNLDDTLSLTLDAIAALTSSATIVATAGKSVIASAQLNSSHTLTAVIGEVFEAAATLNAEFTHTTTGTRIKQFDSAITVNAVCNSTVVKTANGISALQSECAIATIITRIFVLQSNFESIATQLTSVARVGAGLILAETFVTQSTTAVKTAVTQADATVVSAVTITANRFRLTTANTQVEFTLNTVNSRIRALNSAQQTESALTVTTMRIRSTDSTQSSEFTIFCEVLPILRAISNQSAQFVQTTAEDRIRSTTAAFNLEFTQQSTVIIAVNATVALSTQSQINCEVLRIRPGVVIMDAIAVKVTAAAKTGTALVTIESQSQCTVTAQKTTDILLNALATVTITSIIERIQQGVASITSTFTQNTNGVLSTDVVANLHTEFNQTVTAQKTVNAISNIQSDGGFVMAVVAIRNGEIIIITQTNITATADRRRNTGADSNNSFTLNILAGLQAVASSVQNCTVSIAVTAGVLRLDDIILYVKTESRSYSINNEQRSYALRQENRLYTIEE